MRPKALYFDILNYRDDNMALLEEHFDIRRLCTPADINDAVLCDADLLFAPLGYFFGEDIFARAPRLKVVATNTTGVPHIDVPAAEARDITVISLRDDREFLDTITPTAELTMGLMIAATRNLIPGAESVLQGHWSRWGFGGNAMLSRMSLGIVGLGRLGLMVARYASAFGMSVAYYDPFLAETNTFTYARKYRLEDLTAISDIVTVHIPMNESNRRLFSGAVFAGFKPGAYFINTARGEVVDSEALIRALESGRLAGAALDVLDGEFEPGFAERAEKHPLIRYAQGHKNLIITPHIAGSTQDAWHLTQRRVIDRAIRYFKETDGR